MKLPPQVASVPRSSQDTLTRVATELAPQGAGPACRTGYFECTDGTNKWCCQNGQSCGGSMGVCN